MSLRRTVSLVMVLLSVLALASAMSTVQLTKYLVRTVSLLRTNLESVRAARQIDHLNRMVGDLLDAYRIESGNLELRPEEVDARELLREACDPFRNTSAAHELSIELRKHPLSLPVTRPHRSGPEQPSQQCDQVLFGRRPCYGPLKQAGTHVLVEVVDSGTTFTVSIPRRAPTRQTEPMATKNIA